MSFSKLSQRVLPVVFLAPHIHAVLLSFYSQPTCESDLDIVWSHSYNMSANIITRCEIVPAGTDTIEAAYLQSEPGDYYPLHVAELFEDENCGEPLTDITQEVCLTTGGNPQSFQIYGRYDLPGSNSPGTWSIPVGGGNSMGSGGSSDSLPQDSYDDIRPPPAFEEPGALGQTFPIPNYVPTGDDSNPGGIGSSDSYPYSDSLGGLQLPGGFADDFNSPRSMDAGLAQAGVLRYPLTDNNVIADDGIAYGDAGIPGGDADLGDLGYDDGSYDPLYGDLPYPDQDYDFYDYDDSSVDEGYDGYAQPAPGGYDDYAEFDDYSVFDDYEDFDGYQDDDDGSGGYNDGASPAPVVAGGAADIASSDALYDINTAYDGTARGSSSDNSFDSDFYGDDVLPFPNGFLDDNDYLPDNTDISTPAGSSNPVTRDAEFYLTDANENGSPDGWESEDVYRDANTGDIVGYTTERVSYGQDIPGLGGAMLNGPLTTVDPLSDAPDDVDDLDVADGAVDGYSGEVIQDDYNGDVNAGDGDGEYDDEDDEGGIDWSYTPDDLTGDSNLPWSYGSGQAAVVDSY
ncbi:hypothetical protein ABW19_dt0203836 [Dactylella cylindrospora]|nr:hypothetical protein ABW19_dt0203836 [Dactylella cylindrospora]